MLLDLQNHSLCTEYDQFVEQSPYGNLLQSRAWARVKTNWDAVFFYLRRSGVIVASLSLLSIYDQKVGQRFFYVPRGPVVNPEDRESLREILQEALCYAREHDGFLLRVEPNLLDTKENRELSKSLGLPLERHRAFCSQPPLSSILDLGGRSMDEIFDDYSKNTRRNIRSAYRHGLELYIGGREDLPTFYQLIQDMSRMKGLGHRPYSYFESIYEALGERVSLISASSLPSSETRPSPTENDLLSSPSTNALTTRSWQEVWLCATGIHSTLSTAQIPSTTASGRATCWTMRSCVSATGSDAATMTWADSSVLIPMTSSHPSSSASPSRACTAGWASGNLR